MSDTTATTQLLMQRFFQAVSFEPGERPPYETLHDLFIAEGKLIKNSGDVPEIASVDQFIGARQPMIDAGELVSFHEAELAGTTQVFGNVAHRFSTYKKRAVTEGAPQSTKGVISTQFVRTPAGWKISSMAWDDERPGLTIPDL